MNYVIASLKHTHKHDEHITFWSPNRCGYTPVLSRAGQYSNDDAVGLNDGESFIAVTIEAAQALQSPTPYFKPGRQFYDMAGPVVNNSRANWNRLIASSLKEGRENLKPKPEVFRGERRCLPAEAVPA